jgi:hypothetical protein
MCWLLVTIESHRRLTLLRTVTTAPLISKLSRTVDILTADIEHEEARVRVNDVSDPTYPVLAWSLRCEGITSDHWFSGGLGPRDNPKLPKNLCSQRPLRVVRVALGRSADWARGLSAHFAASICIRSTLSHQMQESSVLPSGRRDGRSLFPPCKQRNSVHNINLRLPAGSELWNLRLVPGVPCISLEG